ncbi:MAG: SMC-Scp complex subunit ScpB [Planctomycetota bacterium]|jgi:segregation and condensation protein B
MASEETISDESPAEGDTPAPPTEAETAAEQADALEAEQVVANAARTFKAVPEDDRLAALEAFCFAAAEPLGPARLAGMLGVRPSDVKALAEQLNTQYETNGHGLRIEQVAGGWQLVTRPDLESVLIRLRGPAKDARLSPAALETLAIIAYRQPVLKADIESIRGVGVGPIMKTLQERGLVRVVGRHESLGSPLLYGTTRAFLDHFGLNTLKDLPQADGPAA